MEISMNDNIYEQRKCVPDNGNTTYKTQTQSSLDRFATRSFLSTYSGI